MTNATHPVVLVVDDDADTREALRFALEDDGYRVAEAEDGARALRILRATSGPALLLVDLLMPNLDGYHLIDILAADPVLNERTALIAMSATSPARAHRLSATLAARAVRFVAKPFDIVAFLALVREAAARLHEREAARHDARREASGVSRPRMPIK